MSIDPLSDAKIIDSWGKNASSWTAAVRTGQIESRKLITDYAIVDAILSCAPGSVIDLGCGEGWLVRALAVQGVHAVGLDVVPGLIEQAQQAGGSFQIISYEEIAAGKLKTSADVIACNFSLLGKESVEEIFAVTPALLNPHGSLIVQTLHPINACGAYPYQDGWREGSWAGFGADFTDPAPWYFRTLESWIKLFLNSGFRLREVREPTHPESHQPVSVIFIAEMTGETI
jgi:2-polyprenyl-3-methyl-5-hydroxy-6-metoxy-1,4-benzoquinol methylase